MTTYEVTCLNRFIGRCKHCKRDYDQSHHPNNLDCPEYREMRLVIFNVTDKPREGFSPFVVHSARRDN